jgi:hypothetical protein
VPRVTLSIRAIALVTLLFIVLSIVSTLPLALDPFGNFLGSHADNDMKFNLWVIFWGYHAMLHQPLELHQANIFYPEPNTFVYSDIELSHSLLMAPFIALTYHPEFIYNMLVFLSLVIGGVGWYLFAYRLTGLHSGSIAAAIIIQFCAARFGRITQIQFFADHWMPWTLFALWGWLERKDSKAAWYWPVLAAVFYSLHALSGSHNAVFGTIITAVCGLFLVIRNKHFTDWHFYLRMGIVVAIILLLLVPVFLPYFTVSKEMEEHRVSSRYALQMGSARAVEFFSSGSRFYKWLENTTGWPAQLLDQQRRGSLWPGLIPIVILLGGLFWHGRSKENWVNIKTGPLLSDLFSLTVVIVLLFSVLVLPASPKSATDFFLLPLFWLGTIAVAAILWRFFFRPGQIHGIVPVAYTLIQSPLTKPLPLLWIGLLLFSIWASFGPDALLYDLIGGLPAVNLIRVPRRFFLIGVISLGIIAAFVFKMLRTRFKSSSGLYFVIFFVLLFLFAVESNFAPLETYEVEEPHPLYAWLAEQEGDFTVLEYPVHAKGYSESIRQVYGSIHHWKNLIVGYSGYQSEENIELLTWLNNSFPREEAIKKLGTFDTRFVIVFSDRIGEGKTRLLEKQVDNGLLQPVHSIGKMKIYQLTSWKE